MTTDDKKIQIDTDAKNFQSAHSELSDAARELRGKIESLQREFLPRLRLLADKAFNAKATLTTTIESAPNLFIKPRTQRIHGIKLGFRKSKGKIIIADLKKVIAKIREQLPATQAYDLIKIRETVDKNMLSDIVESDLKRIGVQVKADVDVVVIDTGDKDLERFMENLIDDAEKLTAAKSV